RSLSEPAGDPPASGRGGEDPRPVGDPVLHGVLARLAEPGAARTSRGWIQDFAKGAGLLRTQFPQRLVQPGVLCRVEDRFLCVFPQRRYPKAEERSEVEEVRARLRHVLLDDSIPDPRDALLIGLARATRLLPLLVSPDEAVRAAPRVERIAALEGLSRSLGAPMRDIYAALMRQDAIH
ncbi:MAG: GPP34 family phosphoprotein, partial [Roseomonas sp.]|nr:GPP34 family phosphoprotein [Roseomonas sp.]